MPSAVALFSNMNLTQTVADAGRVVQSPQEWISIGVNISAVSGTNPTAEFRVQWSFDNITWMDAIPQDVIGTATQPVSVIKRLAVLAPYWRLAVKVGGTNPSFTCTANALT